MEILLNIIAILCGIIAFIIYGSLPFIMFHLRKLEIKRNDERGIPTPPIW